MSRFGLGFISGDGVPGNDAFTKILLHMDGSNGGTTFTDVNAGGSAHTWSPVNATTSTANKEFGTAALLTAGGYITTPDSSDFTLGSGDWTFDFWMNCNGTTGSVGLAGQADAVGNLASIPFIINRSAGIGVIQVQVATPSSQSSFQSTTSFSGTSTWNHFALIRNGTALRLYVNGTLEASGSISGALNDSSSNFSIGRIGAGAGFGASSVLFDEVRLSVGIARWTANFTPPIAQYI